MEVGRRGKGANMTTHRIRLGVIGANVELRLDSACPHARDKKHAGLRAGRRVHRARGDSQRSAETFGVPLAFHDHREMLRQADLDAVAVVVRVPAHHRLTMDALDAGKHVYTEWPLGANLQEAKEMADLARGKGVHTMVGLQTRCSPAFLTLKELIDDGYVERYCPAIWTNLPQVFSPGRRTAPGREIGRSAPQL